MARKKLIVGNWKMNKTVEDSIRLVTELKNGLTGKQDAEVVVAPPFTSLHSVEIALQGSSIKLAAQNMHHEEFGAYTGEVSPTMLVDVGVRYVIVGHSERRQHFSETNAAVNKKVHAAMEYDLLPIVCVGETRAERDAGQTLTVIETQVKECLRGLHDTNAHRIILAYEPVWAIGSGQPATPEQAEEVHQFIRERLAVIFRKDIAQEGRILYGGSVTGSNVRDFLKQENIDGVLVGGASLETASFVSLIQPSGE